MDGIAEIIKRVVFRMVKSNKITIHKAGKFAAETSKAMPSIHSIYFSLDDKIIEPSFVKVAPCIQGTLDTNYCKRNFISNGVCFLEFYRFYKIL